MYRGSHAVLASLLILASQVGDASCGDTTTKACWIDTRGVRVERGLVTDVITATCDPRPRTHRLDGWLEYRTGPGEQGRRAGDKETGFTRPDAEGFSMRVESRQCVPGQYRAAWQATGTGPDQIGRAHVRTPATFWGTEVDCREGQ